MIDTFPVWPSWEDQSDAATVKRRLIALQCLLKSARTGRKFRAQRKILRAELKAKTTELAALLLAGE